MQEGADKREARKTQEGKQRDSKETREERGGREAWKEPLSEVCLPP